jgi:hypothetical protein
MNRGVVFTVGLALLVAETAVAADVPLPPPVPGLPEVQLPPLPAPPTVDPPPVKVPVVDVPAVDLPPVEVPAPSVASPPVAAPPPAAPAARRPARSGARSVPAATRSPSRSASRRPEARGPARGRSAPAVRARGVRSAPAAPRLVRRERRLRRTVTRLRACLDGLPSLERRVLVLRSGLGPRRPARSRARVARAMDLSARRVGRLERRGLRRLRGLARGGCSGAERVAPAPAVGAPTTATATWPALAPATLAAAGVPAPDGGRVEVKGERETSSRGGTRPALAPRRAKPQPAVPPPAAVIGRTGDRATDYTLPLLAALVLLGIAFALRELRRRRD